MTLPIPVLVLLGEPRPNVALSPAEPTISELTGRPLRRFHCQMRTQDTQQHEQLTAELRAGGDKATPISDTDAAHWQVAEHTWSSSSKGNEPVVYTHQVQFQEEEQITLERLEFGEVSLPPVRWTYNVTDDVSLLTVLVDCEPGEHDKLEKFLTAARRADTEDTFFPVRWVGVMEQPISMRFGKCVWQPLEQGRVRHVLNFVRAGERQEAGLFDTFLQPAFNRVLESSAQSTSKIDALIAELERAGVLDQAAVARIQASAKEPSAAVEREYERTPDAEMYFG
jgi:hypothetical protein